MVLRLLCTRRSTSNDLLSRCGIVIVVHTVTQQPASNPNLVVTVLHLLRKFFKKTNSAAAEQRNILLPCQSLESVHGQKGRLTAGTQLQSHPRLPS